MFIAELHKELSFEILFSTINQRIDYLKKEVLSVSDFGGINMPKSSMEQIENDEKMILMELQKNAKQSVDEIAKKYGFSRQKVWRIIKKLEEDKIIWGNVAVVNIDKLGLKHYTALFKRKSTK